MRLLLNVHERKHCDFIDNLMGLGGGSGMDYQAQAANVIQGVDPQQLQNNYNQTQRSIWDQQAFVNQLAAQNGIKHLGNLYDQQQGLANQFQNVANGTGPNPALAQLQNTTGQNIANQSAMMAGQRGAGANVGLLARQAAMQGGALQQQAVGQGAALQAQQQMNALQALQGQQSMMGGQALNQTALQLQGANQAAGNNANLYGGLQSSLANFNNANVAMQSNMNSANAGIQGITAQGQGNVFGGVMGAVGLNSAALAGKAHGGEVKPMRYADGGVVLNLPAMPQPSFNLMDNPSGPKSSAGQYFQGMDAPAVQMGSFNQVSQPAAAQAQSSPMMSNDALFQGSKDFASGLGSLAMKGMMAMSGGGAINGEQLAVMKEKVPGKAKVGGDNLKNDTVPAMLSPGEVVIPRSVMNSEDPVGNAAKFVQQVMSRKKMGKA